ncbi:hypothetical protein J5N97_021436 [Dioscorea zingiberensis]|uniref:Uncharacterized protein n=1 Tax=Dioscorea zingiberensis TaxID=325984 RepID=A0A9D5CHN5_9LILI|nr:hypothetical protein J5N97_021436 [Dioscorea zingiberensis]
MGLKYLESPSLLSAFEYSFNKSSKSSPKISSWDCNLELDLELISMKRISNGGWWIRFFRLTSAPHGSRSLTTRTRVRRVFVPALAGAEFADAGVDLVGDVGDGGFYVVDFRDGGGDSGDSAGILIDSVGGLRPSVMGRGWHLAVLAHRYVR